MYGSTLRKAQQCLLPAIPAGACILIAGGGSGWILEAIAQIHPAGLTITYIDASARMISLARQRNAGNNQVTFITARVEDSLAAGNYDVVITPFLFDNFTEETMQKVFGLIDHCLCTQGIWLHVDFRNTEVLWQQMLLKAMYFFFRHCCGIEARTLPDIDIAFAGYGYRQTMRRSFMGGFISADVYKRQVGQNGV